MCKQEALTLGFHQVHQSTQEAAKRFIKRLGQGTYYSARCFYFWELNRLIKRYRQPPLLIYQMGKVGSSTIQRSLDALNLGMPVFHVHYLSKSRVAELEKERRKYFQTEKFGLLKRPWLYQYLHNKLIEKFDGRKCKIVSLTRDPVGRNLSAFFENLEIKPLGENGKYEIKSDYYGIDAQLMETPNLEKLAALFFERLNHDSPLDFFDRELKTVFGIDVYASDFPKSKGYLIYPGEKADVLIMRLENLDQCVQFAFKDFFHIDNVNLLSCNIGEKKPYAAVYTRFKDSVVFPESYIDNLYRSKYMRHFYSEQEIKRLRSKWLRMNETKPLQGDG